MYISVNTNFFYQSFFAQDMLEAPLNWTHICTIALTLSLREYFG